MTVLKGCNFQKQPWPFERLQTFMNGRVDSKRIATFWNQFLLPLNTLIPQTYSLRIFLISSSSSAQNFFVYFTAVEWFADTRVLGINTLVIEIILSWEDIFQIKPRILEGNNFLKGTLCIQWAWSSFCFSRFWYVLQILDLWINLCSSVLHWFSKLW